MQFESCWFLTKGTSLGLILLSLVLLQIRSCINSYREVLFILSEPLLSLCKARLPVCLKCGGLLLPTSTREKEACERPVEKPKHRIMP